MRILQPLRGRSMALLWGGLSLSAVGDQLYAVALTWIAVGVLGSNAGYLGALQAFVALLAVLFIGVWADRWEQMRGMIASDLASAAVLAGVVAATLITGRPGLTGLICAIVVLALGQAVFRPALQSVLPSVVDDTRLLPAANGLMDATQRIARLLGPGLVALLVADVPVIHFLTHRRGHVSGLGGGRVVDPREQATAQAERRRAGAGVERGYCAAIGQPRAIRC